MSFLVSLCPIGIWTHTMLIKLLCKKLFYNMCIRADKNCIFKTVLISLISKTAFLKGCEFNTEMNAF